METFIAENPGVMKYLFWGLIAACVYFWKAGNKKTAQMICDRLEELSEAIKMLVQRDEKKERWMTQLQSQINARDAVCMERGKTWGRRPTGNQP